MTFLESLQVGNNIDRIKEIIDSDVLAKAAMTHRSPLAESALTEFLIRLNDLLQKCKKSGLPVDFSDDIADGSNVTDLVSRLRNAACHMTSDLRLLEDEMPFCFSIIGPWATSGHGSQITNRYPDDVLFCYGDEKAYFERHLCRAYREAVEKLRTLPVDPPPQGHKGGSFWCCWL